jgi:hypothetical protein
MKELTKKVLEAGLIDKTTIRLLERWGTLPPEEVEKLQQKQIVAETMELFLEELELLLQPEALERKEVSLDACEHCGEPVRTSDEHRVTVYDDPNRPYWDCVRKKD